MKLLINEHEDTLANIYRYEDILDRRDSMAQVIINELDDIRREYGKPRKTVIENVAEAVYVEKKIEEMDIVFLMDRFGYARSVDVPTYERKQRKRRIQKINMWYSVRTPVKSVSLQIPDSFTR